MIDVQQEFYRLKDSLNGSCAPLPIQLGDTRDHRSFFSTRRVHE